MDADEAGPPGQSRPQRLKALGKANRIRRHRSEIKGGLRRGEAENIPLLIDPPECILSAGVPEILLAVPGFGKVRVHRILNRCRISTSKRVGGLSDRQRRELVETLTEGLSKVPMNRRD